MIKNTHTHTRIHIRRFEQLTLAHKRLQNPDAPVSGWFNTSRIKNQERQFDSANLDKYSFQDFTCSHLNIPMEELSRSPWANATERRPGYHLHLQRAEEKPNWFCSQMKDFSIKESGGWYWVASLHWACPHIKGFWLALPSSVNWNKCWCVN